MQNRDIIITGLQSWDISIGSNCKNIAEVFSQQNRVLYINPPTDRITAIKGKLKHTAKETYYIKQINHNLWVANMPIIIESISRMGIDAVFDFFNRRNNMQFAKAIRRAADSLGFENIIHFCDSDMFRSYYLKELLKPEVFIYYTRDNLLAVDYWKVQGLRKEPKLMQKADAVVANSQYLADIALQYNPNSYFVGQGCDLSSFSPELYTEVPADIAHIKEPIIGYVGALNSLRLDVGLIEKISVENPQWNFVLVGGEDDAFKNSLLHRLKNVYFTGKKKPEDLPQYINAFTIAINPQKVNEVTIGNYPRKIDEYLAMGKPTIATKTVAMEYFEPYVVLASSAGEWSQAIARSLTSHADDQKQKRMDFAGMHTWENNVQNIYEAIKTTENFAHKASTA